MVKIHKEIDLIVKQENRYITYRNKKGSYNEFAHDFLRFANESKIKQNFNFLEDFLKKNINTDPDDMLGMILDFNGLMEAVNNQTKDVDNDKFNQAQQYWNEAQQNLLDRDLYDAN